MSIERRNQSLASAYKPNVEFDEYLKLFKTNHAKFLELPASLRIEIGHYKERKEAFELLERQRHVSRKNHGGEQAEQKA